MINVEAFLASLKIMGMGMLGIFIVTVVIIAVIWLFNYFTSKKEKKPDDKAN